MKHEHDHPVAKGQHEYKDGSYQKVENFQPSEYPKYVFRGSYATLAKDADHEAKLKEEGYSDRAPKEE